MVFEMFMIFFLVFVSIISLPIFLLYISNVDLIDLEPCCLSVNLWQCFYLVKLQIGGFFSQLFLFEFVVWYLDH